MVKSTGEVVGGAAAGYSSISGGGVRRIADGIRKVTEFAKGRFGVNTVKTFAGHSINDLAKVAAMLDKGDFTFAGRALQKHGNRESSAFPSAQGNPAAINQQAQQIVNEILSNPATTATQRNTGRFGQVIDIVAPDGRGLRYDANGKFIGFLEPPKI